MKPRMPPEILIADERHAEMASALVRESFDRYIAAQWEPQACEAFLQEASVERLRAALPVAAYGAIAMLQGEPAGFIFLPTPSLLAMLFVRPAHLGQGIGAGLWAAARSHLEAHHPDTKTVEVNASTYGVAAYRAMGFYPISEPFRVRGAVATRMACWLPGRTLASAALHSGERGEPTDG